jgi:glycosyltransferase involved in cell wall biosynthesis
MAVHTDDRHVLMISKPVVPPWHDSGKNLVRDLVRAGQRYRYHAMVTDNAHRLNPQVIYEPVYKSRGSYAPGLRQNLAVLKRLLTRDTIPLYHFFFAPNPKSSGMARWVLRMKKRRSVHTICSVPKDFSTVDGCLFADIVVALSQDTCDKLRAVTRRKVVHIPPCIPAGPPMEALRKRNALATLGLATDRPMVLFAGDYQFSNAARICCQALPEILGRTNAEFIFACRIKQEASRLLEAEIKAEVDALGLGDRVHFFNEVEDMEALAAAVTLNVMPTDSLYAKMDLPLVLLESLREGVPIVVSEHGPLPELCSEEEVGRVVPVNDHTAFTEAVVELLSKEGLRWEMGRSARRLVQTKYSPRAVSNAYEALYDELLGNTPEPE